MNSPLSPVIVNIVLQHLETWALRTLDSEFFFYYKYMNDIAMAAIGHGGLHFADVQLLSSKIVIHN